MCRDKCKAISEFLMPLSKKFSVIHVVNITNGRTLTIEKEY